MTKKSNVIVIATDLILIIRNLERIIGHMENIAESVIFIADAKIVRHPRLSAGKQKGDKEITDESDTF
jgi:phosphate uptake regulator